MYDLHIHSKLSDGTQPVSELVAEIATTPLTGFALTDHDTTVGWDEARELAAQNGLDFLPGMEISCAAEGLSIHLLSYGHDPNYQPLLDEIAKARASRETRAKRMVELLSEDFPVTWESVQAQVGPGATVGRPHIADALVEAGIVEDRSVAFADILTARSKYYVSHYAVNPVDAVRLVRAAGGAPVIAHPRARARGRVVSIDLIEEMIDAGLAGLEIQHRDNAEEDRVVLRELASKHDLLITGSSDYHGAGKPNRLGENTTGQDVVAQLREQIKVKS